jgi:hypothetical protein
MVDIPLPQFSALHVIEGNPLPELVVFVYPEHALVPRRSSRLSSSG